MRKPIELKKGAYCYYDVFQGLIPCTCTKVYRENGRYMATAIITETIGAYNEGETVADFAKHIVPIKALFYRNGQARLKSYRVILG